MTTTPTTAPTAPGGATRRTVSLPSAPVLLGVVYCIGVLFLLAIFVCQILFTDVDPHKSEGPIDSIISISVVSSIAAVIAVGGGLLLIRTPGAARIGAVVFGALSVLTLVIFWSGAPGLFGASAAWLAGLTKGGRPLGGIARVAGIVGAFVATLGVVLSVGGVLLSALV